MRECIHEHDVLFMMVTLDILVLFLFEVKDFDISNYFCGNFLIAATYFSSAGCLWRVAKQQNVFETFGGSAQNWEPYECWHQPW